MLNWCVGLCFGATARHSLVHAGLRLSFRHARVHRKASECPRRTNRWSCRLKCVSIRVRVGAWGSLRVADSAAQLNSMFSAGPLPQKARRRVRDLGVRSRSEGLANVGLLRSILAEHFILDRPPDILLSTPGSSLLYRRHRFCRQASKCPRRTNRWSCRLKCVFDSC